MSSVSLEKKALTTIVIVGGGISGLVTAYGLSRLPNSDDLYDIRVLEKRGCKSVSRPLADSGRRRGSRNVRLSSPFDGGKNPSTK